MNKTMRKLLTIVMALALMLSMAASAFAAEVTSAAFKLPTVKERVEESETPAEGEAPAEETPAETPTEEQDIVVDEPTDEPADEPTDEPADAPTDEPTVEEPAEEPAEGEQPEPDAPAPGPIGKATITMKDPTARLNVRASADGDVLGSLDHGTVVTVLANEGEWLKIEYNGGVGYVKANRTTPGAVEETPAEDPPAEETPAEETPAEEPTEETPAEEIPAEEIPAEEIPAEEIPAEEIPVEEIAEETSEYTAIGDADVRLYNHGMSEIILTVADGTPLKVVGVEGDWVMVEIDGRIGYIFKDSVNGVEIEPELDEEGRPTPKVTLFISRRSVVTPGETIYITSKLEGLDGYELSFQWEVDKGNGFEIVPGATGDSHSFEASVETLAYDWQLTVTYDDE